LGGRTRSPRAPVGALPVGSRASGAYHGTGFGTFASAAVQFRDATLSRNEAALQCRFPARRAPGREVR
jgi:hypothetical protein